MKMQFNRELYRKYENLWVAGNKAGHGYAIGHDNDSIEKACKKNNIKILYVPNYQDKIYIGVTLEGFLVCIGYRHGPWAVQIVH